MSVYGDQPDAPVNEEADTRPKSFYAVGKIASEHYLRIYSEYGMSNTALRLFNTYGYWQNMVNLKQGMVSIFLAQALNSKRIVVKGSAERYRDFIFIDDVVEAFIQAVRFNDKKYRVFNIGTGRRTTVAELLDKIVSNLPFDVEVEFASSTPGDQFGIYADAKLASQDLDWEPTIRLDRGLKVMINWIRERQ